jgi:diadenosine tetraphosphate (Ap4A) HIT family hydrolase
MENCDVCQFLSNKPLKNQILATDHWTVGILPDQAYLGRAIITLLRHAPNLAELTSVEWQEFERIMTQLHRAYTTAFGADPLNIGCYMNNGYKTDPPHPHVHWHIFPRYKKPVELKGLTFEDSRYASFFDDDARRIVDQNILEEIVQQLKTHLD